MSDPGQENIITDLFPYDFVKENEVIAVKNGKDLVMGFMLESNLVEGNQKLVFGKRNDLDWGVSITDSCIGLDETDNLLKSLYEVL